MLNNRELMELHSKLDDAVSMYLKAKNSKDDCIRCTMPVRASNLYAILIVLKNIKGIVYPDALTQAVRNQCQADAQEAFKDVPTIDREPVIEDLTAGLGQAAENLPASWKCYTQTEVERIISRVTLKLETSQESRLVASYGKIIASPSRMGDPDSVHLFHESGEAGDFNRKEFNEAISQAAEKFFHDNF